MEATKHPEIKVRLVGEDGNAFAILGRCTMAARRARVSREEIDAFRKEAMSGDYDHLLCTCMEWFDCDGGMDEDEENEVEFEDEEGGAR